MGWYHLKEIRYALWSAYEYVLFWFQYLVVANLIKFEKFQVDSVEIKENVCAFAWEPVGSKFAIIHGESQSMNVSFYSVTTGNIITLAID